MVSDTSVIAGSSKRFVAHRRNRRDGSAQGAQSDEARQRIIRAARQVFSERGYDGATMRAIAARADLSMSSIYYYFSDKRGLYREAVKQANALIRVGIEKSAGEVTLLGRISAFCALVMHAEPQDRSAAAFLVTSILESQRHPERCCNDHDIIDDPDETIIDRRAFVTTMVNGGRERGEFDGEAGDPSALVEMLVDALWGVEFYAGSCHPVRNKADRSATAPRKSIRLDWPTG